MKTILCAAGATLALAAVANADVTIAFGGPYTLTGGQGITTTTGPLTGTLTGIQVTLDYSGAVGASWVADTAVTVDALQWGGYDIYCNGASSYLGGIVGFPNSGTAGAYAGAGAGASVNYAGGSAVVGFANGWSLSGGATLNNVTITLVGVDLVPAPGALALLGAAGLAGSRRRRA